MINNDYNDNAYGLHDTQTSKVGLKNPLLTSLARKMYRERE